MEYCIDKLRTNVAILSLLATSGIEHADRELNLLRINDYNAYLQMYRNLGLQRYLNSEHGRIAYEAGFFLDPNLETRIKKISQINYRLYTEYYNAKLWRSYKPYELLDHKPSLSEVWENIAPTSSRDVKNKALAALDIEFAEKFEDLDLPVISHNSRVLIPGKCCILKGPRSLLTVYVPFIFIPQFISINPLSPVKTEITGFGRVLDHNNDQEVATGSFKFNSQIQQSTDNTCVEWVFEFEQIVEK
jgi:hypothetical protein